MIIEDLKTLGLSTNEATIYLALTESGKIRAGAIIKSTNLHRNIVYSALEALVARNLVAKTITGGVAEYIANDPERFIDEIQIKKELATRVAEKLKKMQTEESREITVYEGIEGIKQSRAKALKFPGETLFVIGASKMVATSEFEKVWRDIHTKRERTGVGLKILYEQSSDKQGLDWRNSLPLSEAKYLPFEAEYPIWFAGIGDHFEIGIPSDEPVVFNIKSKEAVDGLKNYFDYFWNQKVMVFEGDRGFDLAFGDILETLEADDELQIMGIFEFDDEFGKMINDFHEKRSEKGIRSKILLNAGAKKIGSALEKIPHTTIRYLAEGIITPAVFLIYADKTLISLPNQRTFLTIKNAEAAESFRSYFNSIWK